MHVTVDALAIRPGFVRRRGKRMIWAVLMPYCPACPFTLSTPTVLEVLRNQIH
jgi:hypothetical protein